jgi:hypothetical protein
MMRTALSLIAWAAWTILPHGASAAPVPATVAATPYVLPSGQVGPRLTPTGKRLGAWIPQGEDLIEPWHRHLASTSPALAFGELADPPVRATWFQHGPTLVRVQAVYDPVHRVVLYHQGCCGWDETVLARAPSPPDFVIRRDLSAVRTRHGIALGVSAARVVRAYGAARFHASTKAPGLRVLSYWRSQHAHFSGCAWFENFVFRGNRLIEIQAGHSC